MVDDGVNDGKPTVNNSRPTVKTFTGSLPTVNDVRSSVTDSQPTVRDYMQACRVTSLMESR